MHLPHYFSGRISPGLIRLGEGKTIINLAVGLMGIFLPIFLYKLSGDRFGPVAVYYIAWSVLYGFSVGRTARLINHFGFRVSLRIGTALGALYYALLFFVDGASAAFIIPLSVIVLVAHVTLFWLPFHVIFAKLSDHNNRGKEIGALGAVSHLFGVLTPAIAGAVIAWFGFRVLFAAGVVLFISSLLPYRRLPAIAENFTWPFRKFWFEMFRGRNKTLMLVFAADGAQDAFISVVWPVFIFRQLNNYTEVGLITALTGLSLAVSHLAVGRRYNFFSKKTGIIKTGIGLVSLGWIMKIFAVSAWQLLAVDIFHRLANVLIRVPVDTAFYETAAGQKHDIDEFVVQHEIACNLGRAVALILVLLLLIFIDLRFVFVLGALSVFLFGKLGPRLK